MRNYNITMIKTVIKKENFDDDNFTYDLIYEDGTTWSVPNNQNNRHYIEIQEWVAEGNTIETAS
tara:strand:- start:42 stop:233 length:192 start_codon:yes stop_codon:yes gene_type:complete